MQRLLGELKRRRVLNTLSFYVIGAWLLLQVAEVFEGMLPEGFMRWLLICLATCYPVALVIGWFFDVTADGIRRTDALPPDEELPAPRFIDHLMLAGHLAIVMFVTYLLVHPRPPDLAPLPPPSQARTLAVVGFDDAETTPPDERIGEAIAGELREGLTRTAGLKVMGPKTSELLAGAGGARVELADEMEISSLLTGTVAQMGDKVTIDARVITIPDGQSVWQSSFAGPISDIIGLEQEIMRSVVGVIAPTLDPDPVNGPRAEPGQCSQVNEIFLRGKQLATTPGTDPDMMSKRQRGRELLRTATETDPDCALAWEALAVDTITYSLAEFAKAGAMARRALAINDMLPEAWSVLAEIAEQERRWTDSEEYFLKAIYADPTNSRANHYYSEALMARGRVRDAYQYARAVYDREPASHLSNFRMVLTAQYAGDWDAMLKHIRLYFENRPSEGDWMWWERAYALLMKGERDQALAIIDDKVASGETNFPTWYTDCARARDDESARAGISEAMTASFRELKAIVAERREGDRAGEDELDLGWAIFTCDIWIGDGDLATQMLLWQDITELQFIAFFLPEATVLRRHPGFRQHVRESGLLDYWREWGWSDYCSPVGEDDFHCD